jgi:hypothetical protein
MESRFGGVGPREIASIEREVAEELAVGQAPAVVVVSPSSAAIREAIGGDGGGNPRV